jgi:hypothetical protein
VNPELRSLTLAGTVLAACLCGCGEQGRPPAAEEEHSSGELVRVGPYAIRDGVLYRVQDESLEAIAVLPGAGTAQDTLADCVVPIPELERSRFRRLHLSPDTLWAAWETSGPGACVGVVGPRRAPVSVLGRWSAALPDSVLWAPAGRYLAIWLVHPGRRRSLSVFDAGESQRVEMPWELDCAYAEDCDVVRAAWLGGTLLNVEIRLGPAELSVPFEVNVGGAASVEPREET